MPINGGAVTVSLDRKRLSVMATKEGGTLLWRGKSYTLIKDEELILEY